MSDDFEQRLRAKFAEAEQFPCSEPFGAAVRRRIAALRLVRRTLLATAVVAASLATALLAAPLLGAGAMLVADAPGALNGALGALLVSPAGLLLAGLTAAAALAAALGD
jgi:hypothetical protein